MDNRRNRGSSGETLAVNSVAEYPLPKTREFLCTSDVWFPASKSRRMSLPPPGAGDWGKCSTALQENHFHCSLKVFSSVRFGEPSLGDSTYPRGAIFDTRV